MTAAATQGGLNLVQGEYGEAFVKVLAAAAGLSSGKPTPDNGLDQWVARRDGMQSPMELQVKTESSPTFVNRELRYSLDVGAYDRLRRETTSPRYLVVVVVPPTQADWVFDSGALTVLRRRAFYRSLRGLPPTPNTTSVTVSLPLCNLLTTQVLVMMAEGGVA